MPFHPQGVGFFYLIGLPPFLIGGRGVLNLGWPWFAVYLAVVLGFFGFLEIRVMCSHCPHYAEEGWTLTCWANYGAPKLWVYRPGPMSCVEKTMFFLGLFVVFGFPVPFLVLSGSWFAFLLYLVTVGGFGTTLKIFLCSQCMNFACPLNSVDDKTKTLFFDNNPAVAKAWGRWPHEVTETAESTCQHRSAGNEK